LAGLTASNGTVDPETERLRGEAGKLGVETDGMNKDDLVAAIQRKQIAATVRIEAEEREKLKQEYRLTQERSEIIAESESLGIPIELPDPCTVLDLAKARQKLGMEKTRVKPSPETLAIEASEKNYYIFRNLEQDDVDVSCNVGGKYRFDFIPDQIHVLPKYITTYMRKRAVVPVYSRIQVPGATEGSFKEITKKTSVKQRFSFEFVDKAPQEAEFGVVLDEALKAKLLNKELV
jgi:hypothetical protein